MMRSRAPVHWGRCWTEASGSGDCYGDCMDFWRWCRTVFSHKQGLICRQGLKTPIFREGNKMKKQAGGSICAK
jgi:hypothetical protein